MSDISKFPEWVIQIRERCSRTKDVVGQATKEKELQIFHNEEDFDYVYRPCRVSLGPSSADCEDTSAKELKEESLIYFLKKYDIQVDEYYDVLKEVVDELRGAYDGLDQRWRDDTESFLRMMLVDGCFLLELMRSTRSREYNPVIRRILENEQERVCYLHDMLLLENQLPLLLLRKLLDVVYIKPWFYMELEGVYSMFLHGPMNSFGTRNWFTGYEVQGSLHLLDVYRKSLLQQRSKGKTKPHRRRRQTRKFYGTSIPSATELNKVGFNITTSESICLLEIKLHRKTLMLPQIVVDGSTKSIFLNFMALERLHKNATGNEVTSFMYFMGCLIQVAEDANLLKLRGIIDTALPPAEVAELFHRISKNISLHWITPEITGMLAMVRADYNKLSNEWRMDLYQKYLKSPWATMSAVAAILLFTLSIIQTVYTILSYVHRK